MWRSRAEKMAASSISTCSIATTVANRPAGKIAGDDMKRAGRLAQQHDGCSSQGQWLRRHGQQSSGLRHHRADSAKYGLANQFVRRRSDEALRTGHGVPFFDRTRKQRETTVAVTPATVPPSTGLAVSADLTSIGGSPSQMLFDDGSHGDQVAGDRLFFFQTTSA